MTGTSTRLTKEEKEKEKERAKERAKEKAKEAVEDTEREKVEDAEKAEEGAEEIKETKAVMDVLIVVETTMPEIAHRAKVRRAKEEKVERAAGKVKARERA